MGTARPGSRVEAGVQALNDRPPSRLYGRRKGRPLRSRKTRLMDELLPKLQVQLPAKGALDAFGLFPVKPKSIWLEIGFGGGEHLAAQAKQHPEIGFIGCEPFINGIASLLAHIDREQLTNIRIFPDDARQFLDALPEAALARCFILFPDPWPKARHAERRFIGPENLPRLARVLAPGAEMQLASDDPKLILWMRDCMKAAEEFKLIQDSPQPPESWTQTRYEQKALKAARKPVYFSYRRT